MFDFCYLREIKIVKFYLLNRITKDPILSAQIYNMMYQRGQPPLKSDFKVSTIEIPKSVPKISEVKPQFNSRRQELMDALQELKSKNIKTKQDKESIAIIEATLKNGY